MKRIYTILILVAGLLVLLFALVLGVQSGDLQRLWAEGAVAEGTVTGIHGSKGSNSKFYGYTFPVDGRVQTATRRDIPWAARETPIGSKLTVRYDPKNPSRSVTQAELDAAGSWGNRFLLPLIGAALVAWALLRIFRPRRVAPRAGNA